MTSPDNADKNFKQFLESYGDEGFLKLFLANYLFELVKYFLHTEGKDLDDPSYFMHVNYKGIPYTSKESDHFNSLLKKECIKRASTIVDDLRAKDILKRLFSEASPDQVILSLVKEAFQGILRELR